VNCANGTSANHIRASISTPDTPAARITTPAISAYP
jgi:hypothetical protein